MPAPTGYRAPGSPGGQPLPAAPAAPPYNPNDPASVQAYLDQQRIAGSGHAQTGSGFLGAAQIQHQNDPTSLGTQLAYTDITNRQTGGWNPQADLLAYQMNGDPNYARNEAARLQAIGAGQAGRGGAVMDTSALAPWTAGVQGAAGDLGGVGHGLQNAATGDAYQAQLANAGMQGNVAGNQINAANALMGLGTMPAGPSAAELAMQRTGGQAIQQQAALAAGARGGNSALALQNAAANSANIGGNMVGAIGQQRAAEDITNRQFAANALGAAGGMYGAAGQTFGGAGAAYGNAASTNINALNGAGQAFGGQGNLFQGGLGTQAGIGQANLGAEVSQRGMNDQGQLAYNTLGNQLIQQQGGMNIQGDTARTGNYINYYNEKENGYHPPASVFGNPAIDNLVGTGLVVGGTVAGAAVGGPAGAAGGAALGGAAKSGIDKGSDIRMKKDIKPASEASSDVYRMFGGGSPQDQKARMDSRGIQQHARPVAAPPQAPGDFFYQAPVQGYQAPVMPYQAPVQPAFPDAQNFAYQYRDPNQPGTEPGTKYGPMAQDLEKTPAGASVVGEKNGKKFVDTGRLSLLTAGEVAKQRKELDAILRQQPAQIQGTQVAYPSLYGGQ